MRKLSLCRGKDGVTHHLFEGQLDASGECQKTDSHSICNKEDRDNNVCLKECLSEPDMRIRAAELANANEQICGICVSSMYKNN